MNHDTIHLLQISKLVVTKKNDPSYPSYWPPRVPTPAPTAYQ